MKHTDIFNRSYLKTLGLISEAEEAVAEPAVEVVKTVTFTTTEPSLIEALSNGFEEAVFFVNTKDETTGEDTIQEVKIAKDAFGDIEILDAETESDTEDDAEDTEDDAEDDAEDTEEVVECGNVIESEDKIVECREKLIKRK